MTSLKPVTYLLLPRFNIGDKVRLAQWNQHPDPEQMGTVPAWEHYQSLHSAIGIIIKKGKLPLGNEYVVNFGKLEYMFKDLELTGA